MPTRPRPAPRRRSLPPPHRSQQPGDPEESGWSGRVGLLSVLVTALTALVSMWFSHLQFRDEYSVMREELSTSREGAIHDRFSDAIDKLSDEKSRFKRVGHIYALESLMDDSPDAQRMITKSLVAYIREHTDELPSGPGQDDDGLAARPASDIVAALEVVTGRDTARDPAHYRPDLSGTHLAGANLYHAELEGAVLTSANLEGADLREARLNGASLDGARLNGTRLPGAQLKGANLEQAELSKADLTKADLDKADLTGADLTGAELAHANLSGARVSAVQIAAARPTSSTKLSEALAGDPAVRARIAEVEAAGA